MRQSQKKQTEKTALFRANNHQEKSILSNCHKSTQNKSKSTRHKSKCLLSTLKRGVWGQKFENLWDHEPIQPSSQLFRME